MDWEDVLSLSFWLSGIWGCLNLSTKPTHPICLFRGVSFLWFEGQVFVGGLTGFLVITSSCNLLLLIYAFQDRLEDGPLVEVPWSKNKHRPRKNSCSIRSYRVICIHGWILLILHIYYTYLYIIDIWSTIISPYEKKGYNPGWTVHTVVEVAASTQALALGAPVAGKPRVGSRMWYNLPCLGCWFVGVKVGIVKFSWVVGLLSVLGLLGCFWGGWELVAFLFCWAAGECGFRKAGWWFPNLCRVSSCAQRINNRKTGKQAVQDEESTRGISKEEQPQVLQWHQFLNKSTNLKTHGMSWRWRTFHHMAAFFCLPSFHRLSMMPSPAPS